SHHAGIAGRTCGEDRAVAPALSRPSSSRKESHMRLAVLVAVVPFLLAARPSFAACGDQPGDAQAVANTRAQIAQQCDCAGATAHGPYVRCASRVADQAVKAGTISRECADVVVGCASNSTCGRRGSVTCCQTAANGAVTCSVKGDPRKC